MKTTRPVRLKSGSIEGEQRDGLFIFRGIPYARPPVNGLRWCRPQAVTRWDGIRPAVQFGPIAPQERNAWTGIPALDVPGDMSEDCLYLNVWTPTLESAAKLPVMVWIHGGGFALGSGSQPLYDGEELARRGIVLVTLNYRLGPFGFLRLNELTHGRMPSSGLEGLLDQIAALQWVGDNAAALGGDADNVTIFGESAGAFSVCCLMTMPRANGLFRRAIAQSGGASTANSLERAQLSARRFVAGIKDADSCAGLLERATTDDILAAARNLISSPAAPDEEIGVMPFQPVVDGELLPDKPILSMRRGIGSRIDMIAGSTADEWLLFAEPSLLNMTDDQFANWCERRYGANATAKVLRSYAFANNTPPLSRLAVMETDRVFGAPVGQLVAERAAHSAPTFRYRFDHRSPIFEGSLKACHTIELGFIFGTHKLEKYQAFFGVGKSELALANAMQTAWTSFARSGHPILPSDVEWPDSLHSRATLIFDSDQSRLCSTVVHEPERMWSEYAETLVGQV